MTEKREKAAGLGRDAPGRCDSLRRAILRAREGREELVRRLARDLPRETRVRSCIVLAATALPGVEKTPFGLIEAFLVSAAIVEGTLGKRIGREQGARPRGRRLPARRDRLGMLQAWVAPIEATEAKAACVSIEPGLPLGRLIDIDVYGESGIAVHREDLGLARASCLVCNEAAWDCIGTRRHSREELALAVSAILDPARSACERERSDLRRTVRIHEWRGERAGRE
jgi:holo-ACP synthase CitX